METDLLWFSPSLWDRHSKLNRLIWFVFGPESLLPLLKEAPAPIAQLCVGVCECVMVFRAACSLQQPQWEKVNYSRLSLACGGAHGREIRT